MKHNCRLAGYEVFDCAVSLLVKFQIALDTRQAKPSFRGSIHCCNASLKKGK